MRWSVFPAVFLFLRAIHPLAIPVPFRIFMSSESPHAPTQTQCRESAWRRNTSSVSDRFDSVTTEHPSSGMAVQLNQTMGNECGDYQSTVWDAARVFCAYLCSFPGDYWIDKRVLEVGSGTGYCGIVCAKLGAKVVLTDLPEGVDAIRDNCRRNGVEDRTEVRALPWGQHAQQPASSWFSPPYDIVIGCEVGYSLSVQPVLCSTIAAACGRDSVVFIGHEQRWKDVDKWFHEALAHHFHIYEVRGRSKCSCHIHKPLYSRCDV
jgi:predicted nicotinamide N-methyase